MRKYFSVFIAVIGAFLMYSCSSQKLTNQQPTEEMIVGESEVVYFDSVWPEMLKLLYQYIKTNRIS